MRTIKFRAWIDDEIVDWKSIQTEYGFDFVFENPDCQLMQFTGLFDKNSVEIYEGDIIKSIETDEVYKIENFTPLSRITAVDSQTNIGYYSKGKYHQRIGGNYHSDDWISWSEMYEIIGNIYENLELLNQ